jgi:lipid-A-disaccharide synthase-like uncharacterized protein
MAGWTGGHLASGMHRSACCVWLGIIKVVLLWIIGVWWLVGRVGSMVASLRWLVAWWIFGLSS